MSKVIPYMLKRAGRGGWNVIDTKTREIVRHFDERVDAAQFVKEGSYQNKDGEWEPDYEDMMERRAGDPEAKLDAMENSYERYMGL